MFSFSFQSSEAYNTAQSFKDKIMTAPPQNFYIAGQNTSSMAEEVENEKPINDIPTAVQKLLDSYKQQITSFLHYMQSSGYKEQLRRDIDNERVGASYGQYSVLYVLFILYYF